MHGRVDEWTGGEANERTGIILKSPWDSLNYQARKAIACPTK